MACCLFSAKPLSKCWVIVNWPLRNKPQWNFNQNENLSIHENEFETIVCEMAAILSSGGDELTLYVLNSFEKNMNTYLQFISLHLTKMAQIVEIIPHVRQNLTIFLSQSDGCWWPGDTRSQDICSHVIDLLFMKYSIVLVGKVNKWDVMYTLTTFRQPYLVSFEFISIKITCDFVLCERWFTAYCNCFGNYR